MRKRICFILLLIFTVLLSACGGLQITDNGGNSGDSGNTEKKNNTENGANITTKGIPVVMEFTAEW